MTASSRFHDGEAERALLGDVLVLARCYPDVAQLVTAGDFYDPGHRAVFAACGRLHDHGYPIEAQAVRQELGDDLKLIGGAAGLHELLTSSSGSWRRCARTILDWATRRAILTATAEVTDALKDGMAAAEVLDLARGRFAEIDTPRGELPADLVSFTDFLNRPAEQRPPWAIPGQLRVGDRAMIVAPEGTGKSVLARQMAALAAQGIHPMCFQPMPVIRTLLLDLENPDEAIRATWNVINEAALKRHDRNEAEPGAWLWHRPGGINLRTRRDRSAFEAVLAFVRPQLVAIGPVYKLYRTTASESDELAVGEVQATLDDLRARFGFALLMEHHAPKAQGRIRDLLPYGSSLWLRWPEFGFKLIPGKNDSLSIERWRGDRVKASWPTSLVRGGRWPWEGVWPDGTF